MTRIQQHPDPWIVLSARLQRFIASKSGHPEVIVRIAPTATDPTTTWPSGYQPSIAEVLIDSRDVLSLQDDPTHIDPSHPLDRSAYPVLTGWACMAAAHVAHTSWRVDTELDGAEAVAVRALEQARVLKKYVKKHPADRRWIRASARSLFSHDGKNNFLGLVALSRAGILLEIEVTSIIDAYHPSFSKETLEKIFELIDQALEIHDDNVQPLIEVARQITHAMGKGSDAPSDVSRQVQGALLDVSSRAATPSWSGSIAAFRHARSSEADRRIQHQTAAIGTFGRDLTQLSVILRAPDADLRSQARTLVRVLRQASLRPPALQFEPSAQPPGRLRLAEAMRLESQRAAHARLTAKPWGQLRRRPLEQPRLRVGLSWDISGSRLNFCREMANTAWSLARAISQLDGEVAAVAWNSSTMPVVWPGRTPTEVVEPQCHGGSSACPQSLRALSAALQLDDRSSARVVIVMTDLHITNRRYIQIEVDNLVEKGVRVLWITPLVDLKAPRGVHAYADVGVSNIGSSVSEALVQVLRGHYEVTVYNH